MLLQANQKEAVGSRWHEADGSKKLFHKFDEVLEVFLKPHYHFLTFECCLVRYLKGLLRSFQLLRGVKDLALHLTLIYVYNFKTKC